MRDKSSLKSRVPKLRHNSEYVDFVISGAGRTQENSIFWFLKIREKSRFIQIEKTFLQKFIA